MNELERLTEIGKLQIQIDKLIEEINKVKSEQGRLLDWQKFNEAMRKQGVPEIILDNAHEGNWVNVRGGYIHVTLPGFSEFHLHYSCDDGKWKFQGYSRINQNEGKSLAEILAYTKYETEKGGA